MIAEVERCNVVVYGIPPEFPEDHPNYHNCDAMGCPSTGHVLAVFRLPAHLWTADVTTDV